MSTSSVERNITPLTRIVMFCVLAVGNVAVSPAAAEQRSRHVENAVPSPTSDIDAFAYPPGQTLNRQALASETASLASLVGEQ